MKNFKAKLLATLLVIVALAMPTSIANASEGILNISTTVMGRSLTLPIPYKFYINEDKNASDTLPGQKVKNADGFTYNTRQAIAYSPEPSDSQTLPTKMKFEFDATFYMRQSEELLPHVRNIVPPRFQAFLPFVAGSLSGSIFSKLVKPNQSQIDSMPTTEEAGVDSYVDLIARIDERITVNSQISAYLSSHSWRPIYVFDEGYNLLANVKDSYVVGQEVKSFTFPSNDKHTFIVRAVPIDANFTTEQLDAPMKFGFNPAGNSNFTIRNSVANEVAFQRRQMTTEDINKEDNILSKEGKLTEDEISFLKRFNLYTVGNIKGKVKGRAQVPFIGALEPVAVIDENIVPSGIAVGYANPKLTFDPNYPQCKDNISSNTSITNIHYDYNAVASKPGLDGNIPTLTCKGYNFLGWYSDSSVSPEEFKNKLRSELSSTRGGATFFGAIHVNDSGSIFNPNAKITADAIYYAVWEEKVTVTFDKNYDDPNKVISTVELGKGDELGDTNVPLDPTRNGYVFKGWSTDSDATATNAMTLNGSEVINENTTYYAVWEEKVTVAFDSAGGTAVDSVKLAKGDTLTKPEDPARDGYVFQGWVKDGVDFDFSTPINENTTLVAKWAKEKVAVTFDKNYTTPSTVISSVELDKGSELGSNNIPANPTRDGYTFKGWGTTSTATTPLNLTGSEVINQNTTYYAIWEGEELPVKHAFRSSYANKPDLPQPVLDLLPANKTARVGETVRPTDPTQTTVTVDEGRWVFEYYKDEKGARVDDNYNRVVAPGDEVIFTGQWTFEAKAVVAKHTFAPKTGSPELPQAVLDLLPADQNLTVGDNLEPTMPTSQEVNVDGGRWVFTNYEDHPDTVGPNGYTFVGIWEFIPTPVVPVEKVLVTFDKNYDSDRVISTVELDKGSELGSSNIPANPSRDGYTFKGWGATSTSTEPLNLTGSEVINENTTYYAIWEENTKLVQHKFVSISPIMPNLPAAVTDLLPADKTIRMSERAVPTLPANTRVNVPEGQWAFEGYFPQEQGTTTIFTGSWSFTYKTVVAKHSFVPKAGSPALPAEVLALLPADKSLTYGDALTPTQPNPEEVVVTDGKWVFKGYENHPATITTDEYTFVGTWEYVADKVVEKVGASVTIELPTYVLPKAEPTKPQTPKAQKVVLVKKQPTLVNTGVNGIVGASIAIVVLALVGLIALLLRKKQD